MLVEVKGDLLDTECRYIAHGVNCQGVMNSGVARAIFEKHPEVKNEYLDYYWNYMSVKVWDTAEFLGTIHQVVCSEKRTVINCFTQDRYGTDGKTYLSYAALNNCFHEIFDEGIEEVAIPKIGCGLAGGDWEKVRRMLHNMSGSKFKIIVYTP